MRAFDKLIFTAQQLTQILQATLFKTSTRSISGLSTDSRTAQKNNVFLALRGERVDGHKYIDDAIARGCSCIISEEVILPREDVSVIVVKNTLYALGTLAHWYCMQNPARIIAITGSVGKTTTKQYVWSVLSARYETLKTEGNYNNEIGVPLTLFELEEKHQWAVLEMGMNHKGEMERLSKIACPDIALITNIGSSHIENLGSRDAICDAKLEIMEGMPKGAPLIINADEPLLMAKAHEMRAHGVRPITVSMEDPITDYFISDIAVTPQGCSFSLLNSHTGIHYRDIHILQTGAHNVLNAAMAWVVGELCGMQEADIRRGLLRFENTGMRQNIYEYNGMYLIEDCYNASPESMEAALKVLGDIGHNQGGKAIAVLGDMLELGPFTRSLHERVGKAVTENHTDLLFTFGKFASHIAQGSIRYGMQSAAVYRNPDLTDPQTTAQQLAKLCHPGDTILFKASRAVRMERVIDQFKQIFVQPTAPSKQKP